jgi:hypothetical protein
MGFSLAIPPCSRLDVSPAVIPYNGSPSNAKRCNMNAETLQAIHYWGQSENEIPDRPVWAHLSRDELRDLIEHAHLGLRRFKPGNFKVYDRPAPPDRICVELRGVQGLDGFDGSYLVMQGDESSIQSVTIPAYFRKPARGSTLWKFFRAMRAEKLRSGRTCYHRPEKYIPGGDNVWRPVKLDDSFDVVALESEPIICGESPLNESPPPDSVVANTKVKPMPKKKPVTNTAYSFRCDPKWLTDKKQWAAHMGVSFSDYVTEAVNLKQGLEKLMLANNADEFLALAKHFKKKLAGEI